MSVTFVVRFEVKTGMTARFREAILPLIAHVERAPGCVFCELFQSVNNSNGFVCVEEWNSVAAHQAASKNYPPAAVEAVMESIVMPPSVNRYSPLAD
jgi:quinol monooxygenase YgiN